VVITFEFFNCNIFTSRKIIYSIWTTVWWKPHYCRSVFAEIIPQHDRQRQTDGRSRPYLLPWLAELSCRAVKTVIKLLLANSTVIIFCQIATNVRVKYDAGNDGFCDK